MKTANFPPNYSIKNILHCILSDNRAAGKFTTHSKKRRFDATVKKIKTYPGLSSTISISHIKKYPVDGARFFSRVGILPPELVVVDERIQHMCALPFWTVYRAGKGPAYERFGPCPGYDRLPGCPPHAPPPEETQAALDNSDAFIVLQTGLLNERWNDRWKFLVLHRFVSDLSRALGTEAITGIFGSGPCSACTEQQCRYNLKCKKPALHTISLEARGICVDRLCEDLALLTGNNQWKIKWLKHFGLPQQTPEKWKYVEAVSIKLP